MRSAARRHLPAFLSLALLLAPVAARATTPIPYPERVRESVEQAFLEDGKPSEEKIGDYRRYLRDKRRWVVQHSTDFRRRVQGRGKRRATEGAEGSGEVLVLDHALELLGELRDATHPPRIYELGAMILTLDYSTRIFHYPLGTIQTPIYIGNMLVDWSADASTRPGDGDEEASNLVDPASGEFYTPSELDALIERGDDISKLDPPGDGLLWRDPGDISKLDIAGNYLGGGSALHDGVRGVFPSDGAQVEFRRLQLTQTKPKMRVWWSDEECRKRPRREQRECRRLYSFRIGAELHADPVVNSLMSAIGYNSDVSLHVKNIRVNLGDATYDEIARDWTNYFDQQQLWTRTPLDTALLPGEEGHSRDENGEYLVFRAAGIESRPSEMHRIGDYSNGRLDAGAMATGMRETRGLFIFNAWVANTDLKDAENNKVFLRQDDQGRWQVFLAQQDSGNSLGLILAEKADAFPWDVVETDFVQRGFGAVRGRIELNYFALQNTGLYTHATYADHRWAVRLIAELTREQIEAAVALGRFPGGIGDLYVEKLINRRNQLVASFGLSDEFDPIPVDRRITTADGSVKNGKVVEGDFPEETIVHLSEHWRSLIRPIGPVLWQGIRRAAAVGIGAFESIGVDVRVSGNLHLFPELLFNLRREVAPNPSPRDPHHPYIVEDTMTIGARLGVGYIGRGQATLRRRYRIAYPVRSAWDGRLHENQALNWFLPRDVRRGDLPETFVLLRADEMGPGVGVGSPDPFAITPGADAFVDYLWTDRLAVARRADETMVWHDRGTIQRAEGRFWWKFYIPRITILGASAERGDLAGEVFGAPVGAETDEAFIDMLRGDPESLRSLATHAPRETKVSYRQRAMELNLIWLRWRMRDRSDWMELEDPGSSEPIHQYRTAYQRHFTWSFFDNGETFTSHVEGILDGGMSDGDLRGPVVVTSFLIDDLNTHSEEMDRYHRSLRGLGGERRLLARRFRAEDWHQIQESHGLWGRVLVEGQLVLRGGALDALERVDRGAYWKALAEQIELPVERVHRVRKDLSSSHKRRMRARANTPLRQRSAIRGSAQAFASLERARRADDPEDRVNHLTRALRDATFRRGGTYDTIVIETLLRQIGFEKHEDAGDASAQVRIRKAFDDEVTFPQNRDFAGFRGDRHLQGQVDMVVEPFDSIELYRMLDWAWGDSRTDFISPEVLRRRAR